MTSYPDDWIVEPLERVATYRAGRTPSRANDSYWDPDGSSVPWVSISDMEPFGRITATKETVSGKAFREVFREQLVPSGTLLMSFKLTIGRVCTLAVPACHNEAIISLVPRLGIDQRYLGYFLSQIDYTSHHDRQIKGNTLNRAKLDGLDVLLPPENEQKAIADALDHVARTIAVERQILATTAELKRTVMAEVFARGVREEAQKDLQFGPVPQSWEVKELAEVAEVQTGAAKGRKFTDADVVDVPYLRVANVQDGHLDLTKMKTLRIRRAEIERYRLRQDDVVLTEGGDFDKLGRGFIWRGELPLCIHQNHVFAVRTQRQVLLPEFFAYLAQSPYGKAYFLRVAHKTTNLACINSNKLKAFPVVLPSVDEQGEVVAILDGIDKKIEIHKKKHTALAELFKSLLQSLIRGEVRVSDLDLSALDATKLTEVPA